MSEAIELEGIRVRRYGAAQPELEALIPSWLRDGEAKGAQEIRAGRVWRWNGFAVKLFRTRAGLAAQVRSSRAMRSAEIYSEIQPIRSPRPVLATHDAFGRSLLVYEYVEGKQMKDLWTTDSLARERFPEFLAEMHMRGVYHGDFHLDQAIWSAGHWYLIDLEGIRHRLRNFFPKRLVEGHWSRISFDLMFHCKAAPEELRALFDRYLEASGYTDDPDGLWKRISSRVDAHWEEWRAWSREREAQ